MPLDSVRANFYLGFHMVSRLLIDPNVTIPNPSSGLPSWLNYDKFRNIKVVHMLSTPPPPPMSKNPWASRKNDGEQQNQKPTS